MTDVTDPVAFELVATDQAPATSLDPAQLTDRVLAAILWNRMAHKTTKPLTNTEVGHAATAVASGMRFDLRPPDPPLHSHWSVIGLKPGDQPVGLAAAADTEGARP